MIKRLCVLTLIAGLTMSSAHADGPPDPEVDSRVDDVLILAEDRMREKKAEIEKAQRRLDEINASIDKAKEEAEAERKERNRSRSLFLVILDMPSADRRDRLIEAVEDTDLGPVVAASSPNGGGDYPVVMSVHTSPAAADRRRETIRSRLEGDEEPESREIEQ